MIRLHVETDRQQPIYMQLYQHFRTEIQEGKQESGSKLPSIRTLAEELKVSKTTVELAFAQLLAEGYIESRQRSGYYVAQLEASVIVHSRGYNPVPAKADGRKKDAARIEYDFHSASVDPHSFPYKLWRRLSNQATHEVEHDFLRYGGRRGEAGLCKALAAYLHRSRGVNCKPEQMIIGAGTQYLIMLLCQLFGVDGRAIAIEEPGYQDVGKVFRQLGYELKPIPLQEDGLDIQQLIESKAQVVYITPSHQYPYGMVMPYAKRQRLLQWAQETGGIIIEDDYDGEFRYRGKPIPSLQGLDTQGNVIYLGTFSKSLMPSIRTGYVVLPERLSALYEEKLPYMEQTVSRLHQKTLQLLIESGEWERHIRKMRMVYQKKHRATLDAIHSSMGDYVKVSGQDAGLHILLDVKSRLTTAELLEKAEEAGVRVYSTAPMWMGENREQSPKIMLGFGGLSIEDLQEGVRRLHGAWSKYC
ncbi:PLP-dependent aminotransferase family protein [Brevibacillus fluminis]|uniref:MocR-like pyridoxine biosynthesis transcription factor PdxR n=1 Tax=Brevibacillus fluminis TaxID=511487 RepID=UPI001FE71A45|nr:PLP-dependent aminotransferase family protein [Brevibacillus fluminis]